MQKAIVIGTLIAEKKIPSYKIPCKVPFGSILRRALSSKQIPSNRAALYFAKTSKDVQKLIVLEGYSQHPARAYQEADRLLGVQLIVKLNKRGVLCVQKKII